MKKTILLLVFCIGANLLFCQKYPPPFLHVGYIDSVPVFSVLESKKIISITGTDTIEIRSYPQKIFPLVVMDEYEILYSFEKDQYIINKQDTVYYVKDTYDGVAYDYKNDLLYATIDVYSKNNPKEILTLDLRTWKKKLLGIEGYVQKVVGETMFFCIETELNAGNVPWDIYKVNLEEKGRIKLLFKRNALINNFAFSPDGKYLYAYNHKKEQVINTETSEIQNIDGPGFSEESPFFSHDNRFLIFYNPYNFKTVKVQIKI